MHRISDIHPSEQPWVRLESRGPGALTAAELITLVTGSTDLSKADNMLAACDGLTGLARLQDSELKGLGLTSTQVRRLIAAFELGRRLLADWPSGRWMVRSPRDIADRLVMQMGRLEREELRVVLLDTKNHVLRIVTAYQGNVSASLVRVGELYRDAVRLNASAVILVHNHPSGDPTPSPDDLHLTAEALAAGRLLDISLIDHLVIGHDSWVSLRDRGIVMGDIKAKLPERHDD